MAKYTELIIIPIVCDLNTGQSLHDEDEPLLASHWLNDAVLMGDHGQMLKGLCPQRGSAAISSPERAHCVVCIEGMKH